MTNTPVMHKLFVYGTLRQKETPPTHKLSDFAMFDYGRFPYIIPFKGQVVFGNLVEVTAKELSQLDHYEGVPRQLYQRWVVRVGTIDRDKNHEFVECFVYVGDSIAPKLIEGGDWIKYKEGALSEH